MPVWKYNDKCYLGIHEKKVIEYRGDVSNQTPEGNVKLFGCTKDMPYIMDLTLYSYEFQQNEEIFRGYIIFNIFKFIELLHLHNGLERIQFNSCNGTIFIFITLQSIM